MTNYEQILNSMTAEQFAQIMTKPVIVNNSDIFYMTSTGQLFPFNQQGLSDAVNFEYHFLMQQVPENTAPTENITAPEVG